MDNYVNISIDFGVSGAYQMDVRVPIELMLKEVLKLVVEAYDLPMVVKNPVARIQQNGAILLSTDDLTGLKDGMLLRVEQL